MSHQPSLHRRTPIQGTGSRAAIMQGEMASPPLQGPTGAQRGMTLVEILVVVVLIGVAALIALSNLQTLQKRFQLESNVRELTAFLNDVPNHAREQNASVFLVWDGTARAFSTATDSAASNVLDSLNFPQELTVTGPGASILRCDVYGRTFIGASTVMMTASQTVSITHRDTPEASAPTYDLTLSPLWAVGVSR
ncbi:MAG: prepilin-type N-terminal cleavage/methylation domain-containing protein [Thermoanaerobaculales bacterium]|nr:prepilin-type N-terminal cleavage/methylation domain-containing protein [Thermoanaerobaculales bacterium]